MLILCKMLGFWSDPEMKWYTMRRCSWNVNEFRNQKCHQICWHSDCRLVVVPEIARHVFTWEINELSISSIMQ